LTAFVAQNTFRQITINVLLENEKAQY